MSNIFRSISSLALTLLINLTFAFATPPTELTASPFVDRPGYYDFQVLGPVSAGEFWFLANTTTYPSTMADTRRCDLFTSDGTDSGTRKLAEVVSSGKCGPVTKSRVFDGKNFYFGMERVYDVGTSEGIELQIVGPATAVQIAIEPGLIGSSPDSFLVANGRVYFSAQNYNTGREVWTTTGTADSTKLYKDIRPGKESSNASNLTLFRGLIFLSANDGILGQELWALTTETATVAFKENLSIGSTSSFPSHLFERDGLLFFNANVAGRELFATTGVPKEVGRFKDLIQYKSENPRHFSLSSSKYPWTSKLYFLADTLDANGALSWAIWRSDGTEAGTTQVATVSGQPSYVGPLSGGETFVFQRTPTSGSPICEIRSPNGTDTFRCYQPTIINGTLYFIEYATDRYQLARYDVTARNKKTVVVDYMSGLTSLGSTTTTFVARASSNGATYAISDRECPLSSGDKKFPGECGCATPDTDSDNDGSLDCKDVCPTDFYKTTPGACGCGKLDTDSDKDGVADCLDNCPNDPSKTAFGICGCGTADDDTDSDGMPDCRESCDSDPKKTEPGLCGCGNADTDSDTDGILDCKDGCAADAMKTAPGACGCGTVDRDTDGDLTADCQDGCPTDADKITPGSCGCGARDIDIDGDGALDCLDLCKTDKYKKTPGVCGCGVPDIDADKDGILDCNDECHLNKSKQSPGVCGCNAQDIDSDGDGVMDCHDGCVGDARKSSLGACGCGASDTDSDNDGFADCVDGCPSDSKKFSGGFCGCGAAETDTDGDGKPDCVDSCPADAEKQYPGACGCGSSDKDTDGDKTVDCLDPCPTDPEKSYTSGSCGCGVPDTNIDRDFAMDCLDGCPVDAQKTTPGVCGCGIPDEDSNRDGVVDCTQIGLTKQSPPSPEITFSSGSATIRLSTVVGGKSQVNTVTYRFKSRSKGKERWSKAVIQRTKSTSVKVKLPKGVVGVEARYAISALNQQSPQSESVYAEPR